MAETSLCSETGATFFFTLHFGNTCTLHASRFTHYRNVELLTDDTVDAHKEKGEAFHQAMQESKEAIGMVPTARLDLTVAIPSEESDQENIEPMDVETPSGRKRPQPPDDDDSDGEVGVRKVPCLQIVILH